MGPLLTSTVIAALVAALIAALISVLTSERRIAAENVIQARKDWRDRIRGLASEVHKALAFPDGVEATTTLNELHARFSLLVDPHDIMDQEILQLIAAGNAGRADEFTQRVALLLKYDWERAKREASIWRWLCERKPDRVAFTVDYRPGVPHNYRNRRAVCAKFLKNAAGRNSP